MYFEHVVPMLETPLILISAPPVAILNYFFSLSKSLEISLPTGSLPWFLQTREAHQVNHSSRSLLYIPLWQENSSHLRWLLQWLSPLTEHKLHDGGGSISFHGDWAAVHGVAKRQTGLGNWARTHTHSQSSDHSGGGGLVTKSCPTLATP